MSARHAKSPTVGNAQKNKLFASLYDYVEAIVVAMVLLLVFFTFLFRIAGVRGGSMQPTLRQNDMLLLSIHMYTPHHGDVVVIDRHTQEPLIKRVIGVAGDTIFIDKQSGAVYRNGQKLEEAYIYKTFTVPNDLTEAVTVPKGHIFVLGDNRSLSKDSRDEEIGMVDLEDVVGKAIFRVWPLDRIGVVR